MKKNALVEIKQMNIIQILEKVKSEKKAVSDLTLDKNMRKLKDLKSVHKKKKDIAQMLTILKQKQLLAELEEVKEAK